MPLTLAVARTRPSASPKNSFSSGVPTVTRIAPGAPKPPVGRTITPSRSSASNSGLASSPTSAKRKFATAGPGGLEAVLAEDPLELRRGPPR